MIETADSENLPADLATEVAAVAAADGWQSAAAVIERNWDRFVVSRPDELLAALKMLPGEAFVELPSLVQAGNYLQHLVAGTEPARLHGVGGIRPVHDAPTLERLMSLTGRIAAERTAGNLETSVRLVHEAQAVLERTPPPEQDALRPPLVHLLTQWGLGLLFAARGGTPELERAYELARLTDQPAAARRAAGVLAWIDAAAGHAASAREWIANARRTEQVNPRYDAPLHLAAALLHADAGDADRCAEELAALAGTQVGEFWAAAAWVVAAGARTEDERTLAERNLARQLSSRSAALFRFGVNAAYVLAAAGEMSPPGPVPDDVLDGGGDGALLYRARRAYAAGDLAEARRAVRGLSRTSSTRLVVDGMLLDAAAALALDRPDDAAEGFRAAHALVVDHGLSRSFAHIASAHLDGLCALTGLDARLPDRGTTAPAARDSIAVLSTLTPREREVLALLTHDLTVAGLARALHVSPNTVKTLLRSLYRKLGVHTRAEATAVARSSGLR